MNSISTILRTRLKGQKSRLGQVCVGSLIPFFIVFLVAGCGYHLRQSGRPIGLEIRSLAIPLVTSPASTLGFEGEFTKIIREEFISHSSLELASKAKADAVLVASVSRINTQAIGYDITQNTVQGRTLNYELTNKRRVRLQVDAKLIERKTGKPVWEEKGIREEAVFSVSEDPLITRYNWRLAIRSMAQNVGRRLFAKTMERF